MILDLMMAGDLQGLPSKKKKKKRGVLVSARLQNWSLCLEETCVLAS